jgi:hypothetical protein
MYQYVHIDKRIKGGEFQSEVRAAASCSWNLQGPLYFVPKECIKMFFIKSFCE